MAVALSSADAMRRDIPLVVPQTSPEARRRSSDAIKISLSGRGGYDAKILAELRTMRRRIGIHKGLRRTGRQLRLKLRAERCYP
jgi:hypothetical protein